MTGRLVRESYDGGSVTVQTEASPGPWPFVASVAVGQAQLIACQRGVEQAVLHLTVEELTALRDVLTATLDEIAAAV
jgi:hypothetical protein